MSANLDQFLFREPIILVFENVFCQNDLRLGICPKLEERAVNGKIKIVGAVYHIENGKVELIPDNYLNKISKEKK